MNNSIPDSRSPKFKHTRELVRIALDDDMTQEEIAKLCRTQQGVVSTWANGKAKARKEVLEPLLRRYAHRLNRTTARVYLVQRTPCPPWDDTEMGRLAKRLTDEPEVYAREHLTEEAARGWERRFAEIRSVVDWTGSPPVAAGWRQVVGLGDGEALSYDADPSDVAREQYAAGFVGVVRVEGPTVWRHTVGRPTLVLVREGRTAERVDIVLAPHQRWVVHVVGPGLFRLLTQDLREVTGLDRLQWEKDARRVQPRLTWTRSDLVLADDDSARWITTLHDPVDLLGLIAQVDGLLKTAGPHDRAVVPFTLRKSLVEHGYDVPDVTFIASM